MIPIKNAWSLTAFNKNALILMISNLRKLVEKQDEKLGKDRKWLDTCCILP